MSMSQLSPMAELFKSPAHIFTDRRTQYGGSEPQSDEFSSIFSKTQSSYQNGKQTNPRAQGVIQTFPNADGMVRNGRSVQSENRGINTESDGVNSQKSSNMSEPENVKSDKSDEVNTINADGITVKDDENIQAGTNITDGLIAENDTDTHIDTEEKEDLEETERDELLQDVQDSLSAGMVVPNNVVIILEGEKENPTTTDDNIQITEKTVEASDTTAADSKTKENQPIGTQESNVNTDAKTRSPQTEQTFEEQIVQELKTFQNQADSEITVENEVNADTSDEFTKTVNEQPEPQETPETVQTRESTEAGASRQETAGHAEQEKTPESKRTSENKAPAQFEQPQGANAPEVSAESGKEAEKTPVSGEAETADVPEQADNEKTVPLSDDKIVGKTGKRVAFWDLLARTPVTRISNRSTEVKPAAENTENDDLCPLENENDDIIQTETAKKPLSDNNASNENDNAQKDNHAENQVHQPVDIKAESLRMNQSAPKQQAVHTPVTTENMFQAMIERVESMHSGNQSQMEIALKPEFLGKLSLQISMGAAGLQLKIDAANQEVRGMINSQINSLVETLSSKGIEVSKIEVTYAGAQANLSAEAGNRDHQRSSNPRKNAAHAKKTDSVQSVGSETIGLYYASQGSEMRTEADYLDVGLSSVEYRA